MHTRLFLDSDLIDRARAVCGERNAENVVTRALEEFIARRQRAGLVDLFGELEWSPWFDIKAERARH